jgi:hypothetical protein
MIERSQDDFLVMNAGRAHAMQTPRGAFPKSLERWTMLMKTSKWDRAGYAPTGFCINEAKSRSLVLFQSGIIGSLGFMDIGSTIIIWSYELKLSNPYIDLLKSMGSSIIMESLIHVVRERAEGSNALVPR